MLVDPVRAERILGLAAGNAFSPKVAYIYGKQLEEADLIVVNKLDTLDADRAATLVATLAERFPDAKVLTISARDGTNMAEWLAALQGDDMPAGDAMAVDYDTYAEGEALLGWLNATVALDSPAEFDGNAYLVELADAVHRRLADLDIEVAHLKMTLTPDAGTDLAVVNLVRNGGHVEASHTLAEPLTAGECVVNLRAEGDPETLRGVLADALASLGVPATVTHSEAFRPGRPVPTHRMVAG